MMAQRDRLRQSGMWWCILPELPTHLVQELNVGTVVRPMFWKSAKEAKQPQVL